MGVNFSRPFGTGLIRALLPTLKRWAIVIQSLRDGIGAVYNQASVKPIPAGFAAAWLFFCHPPVRGHSIYFHYRL